MCVVDAWYSFGGNVDDYPHPEVDYQGFMGKVIDMNKREPKVWDPVGKRMHHWIDVSKVRSNTHKGGCVVM